MRRWGLVAVVVAIGAVNAVIFKVFEEVIHVGADLVWNEWLDSDTHRWIVVPLAVVLSVLFSMIVRLLRQSRWIKPEVSLHMDIDGDNKTSLKSVGSILAVGASGLIAGASLGPEMPLTESSLALGRWIRTKLRVSREAGRILVASSLGALLVAFLGSLVMMLLPLLLVQQKAKRLTIGAIGAILLAGVSSYGTLWLMDHHVQGFGEIPALSPAGLKDYAAAVVVALGISVLALLLIRLIGWLGERTRQIHQHVPWYLSAGLFGLILGGLYLVGGQVVQFSGSSEIGMLLSDYAQYGAWGLLGLALIKLGATAWSKTTGYRGGLFFPSIFMGVALGLCIGIVFESLAGPGLTIGAIAAIFMALSIPDHPGISRQDYNKGAAVAGLFMIALLPFQLMPLAIIAIIAAGVGNRLLAIVFKAKSKA